MKKTIALIIVFILFTFAGCSGTEVKEEYPHPYENGMRAFVKGDYETARKNFRHVPENDDNYQFALAGEYVSYYALGDKESGAEAHDKLYKRKRTVAPQMAVNIMKEMRTGCHASFSCDRSEGGYICRYYSTTVNVNETRREIYDGTGKMTEYCLFVGENTRLVCSDTGDLKYSVTKISDSRYAVVDNTNLDYKGDPRPISVNYYFAKDGSITVEQGGNQWNSIRHYNPDGTINNIELRHGYQVTFEYDDRGRIVRECYALRGMIQNERLCDYENEKFTIRKYDISIRDVEPWYIYESYLSKTRLDGRKVYLERESIDYGKSFEVLKTYTQEERDSVRYIMEDPTYPSRQSRLKKYEWEPDFDEIERFKMPFYFDRE